MKLKALMTIAALSISTLASASYNGVIYIPTSVKYDVERALVSDLDFIRSDSRFVSYWNKGSLKGFCDGAKKTKSDTSKVVSIISNKFLAESEQFRHKGKTEINKAILNLSHVVSEGLEPILEACSSQNRMKEDQARKLTSFNSKMDKIIFKFFTARNDLSSLISKYGKVIRVFDMANTDSFNGSYKGHQGVMSGYKPCTVDVKVKADKAVVTFKDSDSNFSVSRKLVGLSTEKIKLKNFLFNKEIETNTICSQNGTSFAHLNYEDGKLVDLKMTHRKHSRPTSGFGVLYSCISQKEETLPNIFAQKYKCFDLEAR
jgi:hypothetical protein